VGILLGVRSCLLVMLLATLTTFTGAGEAVGGGGGGGASRNVSNCCCLGRASVNHNGIKKRTPITSNSRKNEVVVAQVLRLRCPTVEVSKMFSNISLSLSWALGESRAFVVLFSICSLFTTGEIVFLVTSIPHGSFRSVKLMELAV